MVAMKRIQAFLLCDEIDGNMIKHDKENTEN